MLTGVVGSRTPTVSVVMPSYMHAPYVGAAIRSVLEQGFEDLELIVVDDGSSDGSVEVIREACGTDDRARLVQHEHALNHGLPATLRLGTTEARGTQLAFIASDDLWLSHRLESQVAEVARQGAAYARAALIDDTETYRIDVPKYGVDGRGLFRQLLWKNVVPATTIMVRRDVFDAVGGFYGEPRYEDLDLMLRVSSRCEVSYLPTVVAHHRMLTSGIEQTVTADGRAVLSYIEAIDRLVAWPGLTATRRRQAQRWHQAWHALLDIGAGSAPGITDVVAVRVAWLAAVHEEYMAPEQRDRLAAFVGALTGARSWIYRAAHRTTERVERGRELRHDRGAAAVAAGAVRSLWAASRR